MARGLRLERIGGRRAARRERDRARAAGPPEDGTAAFAHLQRNRAAAPPRLLDGPEGAAFVKADARFAPRRRPDGAGSCAPRSPSLILETAS